jgi:hypothetical protein
MSLPKRIYWAQKMFSKTVIITDPFAEEIGRMIMKPFSSDVEVNINGKTYFYDVKGFFNKEVVITDDSHDTIGHIKVSTRDKAILTLKNGKIFNWERKDFFMREWSMIHDRPGTDLDPLVIAYRRVKEFFNEHGRITIEEQGYEYEELIVMTGFFLGSYFLRRKRRRST